MLKSFTAEMRSVTRSRRGKRNFKVLSRFFLVFAGLVCIYTIAFHLLMLHVEDPPQEHTWLTGFYWTLTVMSTLGFGDITFHTDIGRAFSIVVLLSGTLFMLVLLPFTFIEFFYEPWMAAQAAMRAPRKLPPDTADHVLLTHDDALTGAVIKRLGQYDRPYALIVPEVDEALRLFDEGVNVMVGKHDDPETWQRARADHAALVACTSTDVANTLAAFTVRAMNNEMPIVAAATDEASVDILKLAGASFVLRLEEMIGQSFARRTLGGDATAHVIGRFDDLLIAEANAHRTPLVGQTLREARLREDLGVTVVGVWERGRFSSARADTVFHENTVLLLAGTEEHITNYDEMFVIYNVSDHPVVIIGGGRVGRATAHALEAQGQDYRIVERLPDRILPTGKYVIGSAADLDVLEEAGIRKASTVIITPHDDEMNVYLTIYCRKLRPDIQILARATQDRTVETLHRAGADTVLSYASMGASAIMNILQRGTLVMVADGLDMFKQPMPAALAGRTLIESRIREETGCNLVAIRTADGKQVVPNPTTVLPPDAEIVLIGTEDAETQFLERYRQHDDKSSPSQGV